MGKRYGYTVSKIGNETTIKLDNSKCVSTVEGVNKFGTYVKGNILYHNGVPLVQSNNERPSLRGITKSFGEVVMATQGKQCINITIENYNKLLHNDRVKGYKLYNRYDVYNLVDNVTNAPTIEYTEQDDGYLFNINGESILWPTKTNVIYNNIKGFNTHNIYNYEANIQHTESPYLNVRHFNPVITNGQAITLECYVSDVYNSVLNYDTIGPVTKGSEYLGNGKYTIVIKTEDSGETPVAIKTIYAGTTYITIPTNSLVIKNDNEDRETWFSIQCIDSRGVGSVQQFLDVYVKVDRSEDYINAHMLDASNADWLLDRYGIHYDNDDNTEKGFKNKIAFSKLFEDVKTNGYDGIKLPNHEYYLDYHENLGTLGETVVPETSEHTFKFYHISDTHSSMDALDRTAELMRKNTDVKFTIHTGDYVKDEDSGYNSATDTFTKATDEATKNKLRALGSEFGSRFLLLNGNHDMYDAFGGRSLSNIGNTTCKVGTKFLHSILHDNVNWGDSYDSNEADDVARSSYWYKDYPITNNSKLRIIGLDQYEYRTGHNMNDPSAFNGRSFTSMYPTVYTQQQIDWFIQCLKGSDDYDSDTGTGIAPLTENDYLLIASHTPLVQWYAFDPTGEHYEESAIRIRRLNKFCSSKVRTWFSSYYNGSLFPIIMNAYLHPDTDGTLDEIIYNMESSNESSVNNVELQATFEDAPCTFLGYLCGHVHADIHCYHPVYPDQLIMCIDCSNGNNGIIGPVSDMRSDVRINGGITINEVTLDFDTKKICIKRIGNDYTNSYNVGTVPSVPGKADYGDIHSIGYTYRPTDRLKIDFNFIRDTYDDGSYYKLTNVNDAFGHPIREYKDNGDDNITLVPQGTIDLGTQKYYYAEVENGYIKKDNSGNPIIEPRTLQQIVEDYDGIFRYPENLDYGNVDIQVGSICYPGDTSWSNLPLTTYTYIKTHYKYLRTFKLDKDIYYYSTSNVSLVNVPLGFKYKLPAIVQNRHSTVDENGNTVKQGLYFVYTTARAASIEVTSRKPPVPRNYKEYDPYNLVFPNHFTIDMNGSTFIAATTYDVDRGHLINFFYNVDTHIKNGYFEGLYQRFKDLFLLARLAVVHNPVGEGMGVFRCERSRFCSIDNIDISGAIGYDCVCGTLGVTGGNDNSDVHMTNNRYVDASGNVVETDLERIATEYDDTYEPKEGEPLVKDAKLVLDKNRSNVAIGRMDKAGYVLCGKRYEIYISFYKSGNYDDDNDIFIKTIKTKLYDNVKVPKDAEFVRVTGYGCKHSDPAKASDFTRSHGRGLISIAQPYYTIGLAIKNCTLHDCRTTAITNPQGRQILYDNITFYNCASTQYLGLGAGGRITPFLGDFEDSWQWAKYITVKNCKCVGGINEVNEDGETYSASRLLVAYNAEHFDFIGNINLSLKQGGGIESGLIKDNIIKVWNLLRTRSCFHPHVEMSDNNANTVNVTTTLYDSIKETINPPAEPEEGEEVTPTESSDTEEIYADVTEVDSDYDDTIEPVIAFSNCIFDNNIVYGYFKLRHCKVDTINVDYIN